MPAYFFMYYIYILFSSSSNLYYVGYSLDVNRRLIEHNTSDKNTFSSKHRPWHLMAFFSCGYNEVVVIKLERFIKKQKSRKLIEQLIDPRFIPDGALAQLVRVPDVRD